MRLLRHFILLCLGFALVGADAAVSQPPSTKPVDGIRELGVPHLAIRGARVVVEPGVIRESCSILIRDGKIVDIGTDITLPAGALVVDLTGKTIYPGLIESYSETEFPAQPLDQGSPYWNAQVGPERSLGLVYKPDPDKLAKFRKAGFTAILVAPASGIIRGTSCIVSTLNESATQVMIKAKAADHLRLTVARRFAPGGAGGVEQLYPNSPMGAVALARQAFLDAQWYRSAWQAYRAQPSLPQPELNASLQALQEWQDSLRPAIFDTGNEQYAMRADQFAREFGLPAVLRGSGREYRLLDEMRRMGRTMIIPINFPKPPDVSSAALADDVTLGDLMHWELAPENPARLVQAGVPFAFTTDGLSDPNEWLEQVRIAVERGLDGDAALKAWTTLPAKLFGIDDQVGSLHVGKWANFMITDGDLWNRKTKIVETWVQGRRFELQESPFAEWAGEWSLALSANQDFPTTLTLQFDAGTRVGGVLRVADAESTHSDSSEAAEDKPQSEMDSPSSSEDSPASTEEAAQPPAEASPSDVAESTNLDAEIEPPASEAESQTPPAATEATAPTQDTTANPSANEPTPNASEAKKSEARLDAVKTQDLRLNAQFSVKKLLDSGEGVAQLSMSQLRSGDGIKLVGAIVWPDGSVSPFVANRLSNAGSDKDSTASEATDGSNRSEERERSGTMRGRGRSNSSSPDPSKKEPHATQTLSQTNYPFGEYGRSGLPAQPEWVVIRGATVWTCSTLGTLENASLLVHRGVIAAVGTDVEIPEGAIVIDAQGMHVSPGLIDCHSHMATDGGVNESGQAITAEVRIGDFIDAEDISIYRQLAGGLTTANILHGSANPIGGQNQVIKLRWGGTYHDLKFREAPPGIKFALGENVTRANSSGRDGPVRYPRSRMGVDEIYRDRFEAAREYDRRWKEWSQRAEGLPPRRDLELEALVEILRGERWIHCHSYRQDEILAFLNMLEDYGILIGSLQHILEGYKVAEVLARHGATASSFSDWWAYKMEVYDAIPYNGALLHRAGVVVSFNSDDAELARHMNHEAAKAVKYGGVPPAEALQFVTLNPAKQLRIDAWVGSLEVGKHADFVLWSGSPLSVMSRCEQTWIDGRKYFDRQEDLQVRQTISSMRNQLIQKILASGSEMARPGERPFDPSAEWPRHDEFCHHHDDDGDLHDEE